MDSQHDTPQDQQSESFQYKNGHIIAELGMQQIRPAEIAKIQRDCSDPKCREDFVAGLSSGAMDYESGRILDDPPALPGVRPKPKNANRVTSYTASELRQMEFGCAKHVVPGILSEGCTIFAGRAKIGKTFFALDVALAKSCGGKVFGSIQVTKGRVLFIALEGTNRNLKQRLRKMLEGDPWPANLHIEREWPKGDEAVDKLREWMERYPDTTLIIIDTVKGVRNTGSRRRSAYDVDYEAVKPFADFCEEYDVSMLLLHHTNKGDWIDAFDMISGSMGLRGAVDNEAVLVREESGKGVILHAQGRDQERIEVLFTFDPQILTWLVQGDVADIQSNDNRQLIYGVLKDNTPLEMSPKDVYGELKKRGYKESDSAMRHMLRTMMHDEKTGVISPTDGMYAIDTRRLAEGGV